MNKKILILTTGFLLFPVFCFGTVNYERNPSGYTIQNPVTFDVAFDDFVELGCYAEYHDYWSITIDNEIPHPSAICLASTTTNYLFSETLPFQEFVSVYFICAKNSDCSDYMPSTSTLEYNEGEPIFEMVAGGGGLFTLPIGLVSSSTTMIGSYFTDLKAPLGLLFGTLLFMWVAGWVIVKFKEKK